jgi:hypothetical protein
MADSPTYVFADDGLVYAYVNGRIVASAKDVTELEAKEADFVPFEKKDEEEENEQTPEATDEEKPKKKATHIVTPNGLKGQILGRVKGMWGDQVTVRLENGRIAKFDVTSDSKVSYTHEEKEVTSPYTALQERLDAQVDPDRGSLVARIAELKKIQRQAKTLYSSAKYVDETTIHNMVVAADHEIRQIGDAIEALDQGDPYTPPEPVVFEQADMGHGDTSWLDQVGAETEAEDAALNEVDHVDESAEILAAELSDEMINDAEGIAMAASRRSARLTPENKARFMDRFAAALARERTSRFHEAHLQKQASTEENHDGPAEGLFF